MAVRIRIFLLKLFIVSSLTIILVEKQVIAEEEQQAPLKNSIRAANTT